MSSQYIHLQIGGYGIGVGNACWELYLAENGLQTNGCVIKDRSLKVANSFFREVEQDKYKARTILFDTDSSEFEKLDCSKVSHLLSAQSVRSCETNDYKVYDDLLERFKKDEPLWNEALRIEAERCDLLSGFIIINSSKGMTGSGMGCGILQLLTNNYPTNNKITFTEYSGSALDGMRTYLTGMYQSNGSILTDCTFCLEMDAAGKYLKNIHGIQSPSMRDCNQILAQAISNLTMFDRLGPSGAGQLRHLTANLQLSKQIHYPILLYNTDKNDQEKTWDLTKGLFNAQHCFSSIDPRKGHFIGSCFHYRGIDSKKSASTDLRKARNLSPYRDMIGSSVAEIDFLPNIPMSLLSEQRQNIRRSATMALHSTSIRHYWRQLAQRLRFLHERHAFFQNFEPDFFSNFPNAIEDVVHLAAIYDELEEMEQQPQQEETDATPSN